MASVLQPERAAEAQSAADSRRARTIGLRFKRKLPQVQQVVPEPSCRVRYPLKGLNPQDLDAQDLDLRLRPENQEPD